MEEDDVDFASSVAYSAVEVAADVAHAGLELGEGVDEFDVPPK